MLDTLISFIAELNFEPFITFVIGVLTVLISLNQNRYSTAFNRLTKVYHPLFIAIEPYLYKNIEQENLQKVLDVYNKIESEHCILLNPNLRFHMNNILVFKNICETDKYGHNEWFYICDNISKEYDKLCRQCFLPVRNIAYRISKRQYKSKFTMVLGILWLNMPALIMFSFLFGLFAPKILLISYSILLCYLAFIFIEGIV